MNSCKAIIFLTAGLLTRGILFNCLIKGNGIVFFNQAVEISRVLLAKFLGQHFLYGGYLLQIIYLRCSIFIRDLLEKILSNIRCKPFVNSSGKVLFLSTVLMEAILM